jgi:DNA-binding CsgD family transcriptional regulator
VERVESVRNLENQAFSRVSISNLLSELSPQEFEVLWYLTDPDVTMKRIAIMCDLSISQINTIRHSLLTKASAMLGY